MFKRLLFVAQLLVLSFCVQAQFLEPDYEPKNYDMLRVGSVFMLPKRDTVNLISSDSVGLVIFRPQDNTVYVKKPGKWIAIASGFGVALDSARRSNDTLYFRRTSGGELAIKMTGIPQANINALVDSLLSKPTYSAADARYIQLTQKGAANGVASLDAGGKVNMSQIPDALLGAVNYQGGYNAATNTPSLPAASSGNKGYYWVVSTAGTQFGLTLAVGDWIISNGSVYQKVDNNNAVTSVAGRTGAVVIDTGDISNFAFKVRALHAAGTGISYTSSTGVITNTGILNQTASQESKSFRINGYGYVDKLRAGIGYLYTGDSKIYSGTNLSGDPHLRFLNFFDATMDAGIDTTLTVSLTRINSNIVSLTDPGYAGYYVRSGQMLGQIGGQGAIQSNSSAAGQVSTGGAVATIGMYAESDFTTSSTQSGNIRFRVKSNGGALTERMRLSSGGRLGIGTNSPTSTLHVSGSIAASFTAAAVSVTLSEVHRTVRCTVAGITITLPAASTCLGREYHIMNYATGGDINISAVLVNGVSTTIIPTGQNWIVESDGTNWYKTN